MVLTVHRELSVCAINFYYLVTIQVACALLDLKASIEAFAILEKTPLSKCGHPIIINCTVVLPMTFISLCGHQIVLNMQDMITCNTIKQHRIFLYRDMDELKFS